jgi:predicted enzyme related to lactoylglutathione lyase
VTAIRRVVSNIRTTNMEASETFYTQVLGFVKAMDLGWIQTYVAPHNPTTQISVLTDDPSGLHPNLSIDVADVDSVHAMALAHGADIIYGLRDEPWGVRRFFVREPNGMIINVVSHQDE